jgi:hypothetical protein
MYYDITDAPLPSERAHKLTWEFVERDQKLMARLVVEFGGCEFEVPFATRRDQYAVVRPRGGAHAYIRSQCREIST